MQTPARRLSDNDRNAVRNVAVSFVSGSKACGNAGALFTDQDCVSYVHHRILDRIKKNKNINKNKNNGGAGVRSLP